MTKRKGPGRPPLPKYRKRVNKTIRFSPQEWKRVEALCSHENDVLGKIHDPTVFVRWVIVGFLNWYDTAKEIKKVAETKA